MKEKGMKKKKKQGEKKDDVRRGFKRVALAAADMSDRAQPRCQPPTIRAVTARRDATRPARDLAAQHGAIDLSVTSNDANRALSLATSLSWRLYLPRLVHRWPPQLPSTTPGVHFSWRRPPDMHTYTGDSRLTTLCFSHSPHEGSGEYLTDESILISPEPKIHFQQIWACRKRCRRNIHDGGWGWGAWLIAKEGGVDWGLDEWKTVIKLQHRHASIATLFAHTDWCSSFMAGCCFSSPPPTYFFPLVFAIAFLLWEIVSVCGSLSRPIRARPAYLSISWWDKCKRDHKVWSSDASMLSHPLRIALQTLRYINPRTLPRPPHTTTKFYSQTTTNPKVNSTRAWEEGKRGRVHAKSGRGLSRET